MQELGFALCLVAVLLLFQVQLVELALRPFTFALLAGLSLSFALADLEFMREQAEQGLVGSLFRG